LVLLKLMAASLVKVTAAAGSTVETKAVMNAARRLERNALFIEFADLLNNNSSVHPVVGQDSTEPGLRL
jgi:hypothetical protein